MALKVSNNSSEKIQEYKEKLEAEVTSDEALHLYDKYKGSEHTLKSWDIAKDEGAVEGDVVRNRKRLNQLVWLTKVVNTAIDKIRWQEEREQRKLTNGEILRLVQYSYDVVVNDVAVNWASISNNKK